MIMPRACREYISLRASAEPDENYRLDRAIIDDLQPLVAGKEAGWIARPLYTLDDVEDEDLDPDQLLAASGGQLPVIFVNVTFRTEELSGADLAEWEHRHELRLLHEFTSSGA
jgi:hypothetical protein